MNLNIVVKQSQTHGKGVFANKEFRKGEIVIKHNLSSKITKKDYDQLSDKEKIYVSIVNGEHIIMQSPSKYVNHSCNPNMKTENGCDVAIRNIRKGEELFVDYSKEIPQGEKWICKCGSNNCKGVVESI